MKKSTLIIALAVVFVLAFATTAFATGAKTWNYGTDYYTWGSTFGTGVSTNTPILKNVGANPTNPGVHGNYLANTAKCGICHSVHRAKGNGVKLLNTATATCAGCHRAGTQTVTNVVVSWQTGGPHSSGTDGSCTARSCHMTNPHGAGGSKYKIVAAKLLSPNTDYKLTNYALNDVASGITLADLNAEATSTWDEATRSAVRTGYNCNQADCHVQTLLTVLNKGYSEQRYVDYNAPAWPDGRTLANGGYVMKTGHQTVVEADAVRGVAFAPVDSCVSCHDQSDAATAGNPYSTVSGFTFPHSQTPRGASNFGAARAWLWMGYAGSLEDTVTGMANNTDKAFDGACLKCHRSGTSGIGLTK